MNLERGNMKKVFISFIIIILVFITVSTNELSVYARPDEPNPPDLCGSSSTNYQSIYLDGSVNCSLESTSDIDWLRFVPTRDVPVSVYSTGSTNTKIYVYESTNLSSPIAYNNDAYETGTHYTSGNNFYTEFYAEYGKVYYFKIDGYYSTSYGSYSVYLDSCECVYDPDDYLSIYNAVDSGKKIHYDVNSLYSSLIADAISEWNKLGTVTITPDTSSTIKDLHFYDYFEDDPGAASYAVAYYYYRPAIHDLIYFNTYFFEGQTNVSSWNNYWGNDIGKTKTIIHEIGHALGINMDASSVIKAFFNPDWNLQLSNESDYNAMLQGIAPMYIYSPGPCDRDTYREKWDE